MKNPATRTNVLGQSCLSTLSTLFFVLIFSCAFGLQIAFVDTMEKRRVNLISEAIALGAIPSTVNVDIRLVKRSDKSSVTVTFRKQGDPDGSPLHTTTVKNYHIVAVDPFQSKT